MTTILFFGGYLSTGIELAAWENSLGKQIPTYNVLTIPYPQGATAEAPLDKFKGTSILAAKIQNDTKPTIIVGHSSGCAIANAVADKVRILGRTDFRLIALDGFKPNTELLNFKGTSCWSARCGTHTSLNFNALKATPNFHVYEATNCNNQWPLHFSLVNKASSDELVTSISKGYEQCIANLCWL